MNQRAGGNRNGRDPSNDGGETSDVFDMKALAASARSAATPSPRVRPLGLSGGVGRRDSVVGMRIHEPAPKSPGLAWAWVFAGCLTVLAPGAGGVWWFLTRSTALPAIAVHVAAPAPAAAPAHLAAAAGPPPVEAVEIKPAERGAAHDPDSADSQKKMAKADLPTEKDQPSGKAERTPRHHSGDAKRLAQAAAGGESPAAVSDESEAPSNKPEKAEKTADNDKDKDKDKEEKADKPEKAAAPEKPAEAAEEEPPTSAPPKTVRELKAALNRLQSKVVLCHNRFEVDGTAQVAVLVSPSGTVESIHLKGDFEGTPTGDCIVRQLSSASFPTFDGSDAIRVSHSYSLE